MKKSLEKKLTPSLSQAQLVTLALHRLGGAKRAIDTEDVAVEAHRISPSRFSWKKYPNQINLELIRVFSDAKKSALVIGSGRTGWRLTQRGLKWAEEVRRPWGIGLGTNPCSVPRRLHRRTALASRAVAQRRDCAWQLRCLGAATYAAQAKQVFRIDSYARGELRETKITRLRAMFLHDQELGPFLDRLIEDLNRETTA